MRRSWLPLLLSALTVVPLAAQRYGGFRPSLSRPARYDGRFTLARLTYPFYPGWSYDWPDMEENLGRILPEISALTPHPDRYNIFRMDDPELLKYPVAYLSEPGYWHPTESEVIGLRTYLQKGGFLIVDDFMLNEWYNFEQQMLRVLPGA